ncbi:MAG TPA: amidohydrolase family protein [Burkholderiales bacterium]|nr:amidohydrolase family protein [Burkholderiales bacterium]
MNRISSDCIDIHNHIVPERFPAYAGKGRDVPWPSMAEAHACHKHVMISGKNYRTVADGSWSVPRRIEAMGEMRVSRQALSPMPELLSYWLPLEDSKALIRYLNEQIAEMIALAPQRFVGLGAVPLQDMESALLELDFVLKKLKFSGVEIASHVNGVSIGDARFEPFFAAAEKAGAAVFVHALRPAGQDRIVGAFTEQAVCFPGDIALAAASMITGGIAARHPMLRIAFSHGGGGLAMLLPRLVRAWNVLPKAKESLAESPAVYARRFFYDALMFDPATVRIVVESFGGSQVCVGSDYPFAMGDTDPLGTLEKAGLDAGVVEAIKSANARRFLGI